MSKNWPISMICHDWQAGASTKHLCKIYGFSSQRAWTDRISKWRRQGWEFEHRKAGAPKKKKLGQITKTWWDELTDSEQTTAGAIRQTRGSK